MQKNNNKFYKCIIAISLCFVLLFVGIFSAFAFEFVDDPDISQISFGDFIVQNITVSVTMEGTGYDLVESAVISPVEAYPGAVRFELNLSDKFVEGFQYMLRLRMRVPDYIVDSNDFFLGSYDLWLRRNGEFSIGDVYMNYRYSSMSGQQNGKYRLTSYDNFPTVRVIYDTQTYGTHYDSYYTNFSFYSSQATDTLYFYLANYNMDLVDPDGDVISGIDGSTSKVQSSISATQSAITNNNNSNTSKVQSSISATQSAITSNNNSNTSKVQSSISATQSAITSNNNSNTSKVQSSIAKTESNIKANADKNASDVQSNADKNASSMMSNANQNASDIQANADKNASDIQSNANKNHEEMLRGEEYDKMDGQSVDDYKNAESQLNVTTSQAQSDSISFINNFGSIFNGKHVTKGLLSVSAIFKEFFAVSWLSEVLTFGLGLGIFGFILGTVSMVVRSHGSKQSHSDNSFKSKKGGGS